MRIQSIDNQKQPNFKMRWSTDYRDKASLLKLTNMCTNPSQLLNDLGNSPKLFAKTIGLEHPTLKVIKLHNVQEPAIHISVASHTVPWAKPIDGWHDNITPTKAVKLLKKTILNIFEELKADTSGKVPVTKNDIGRFMAKINNAE